MTGGTNHGDAMWGRGVKGGAGSLDTTLGWPLEMAPIRNMLHPLITSELSSSHKRGIIDASSPCGTVRVQKGKLDLMHETWGGEERPGPGVKISDGTNSVQLQEVTDCQKGAVTLRTCSQRACDMEPTVHHWRFTIRQDCDRTDRAIGPTE